MDKGNDLFYVCSLIEYIGRERKLRRTEVVAGLGEETIRRIYRYADMKDTAPWLTWATNWERFACFPGASGPTAPSFSPSPVPASRRSWCCWQAAM